MARRFYYPKYQIEEGLYTPGGEYRVESTNREYKGQYHKYADGEIYTRHKYIEGQSLRLIPLQYGTFKDPGDEVYDGLKPQVSERIKEYVLPIEKKPTPTAQDYRKGFIERNIVRKFNSREYPLIEILIKEYGRTNRLDPNYARITLQWKISGPLRDTTTPDGTILEAGIIDENFRTLVNLVNLVPDIFVKFPNLQEFSRR